MKPAVTDLLLLMVTQQVVEVPPQAPVQPVKTEPELDTAVSFTTVPAGKDSMQSVPQLMPDGELVTVPLPVPVLPTVSVYVVVFKVNVAVTDLASLKERVQVFVPVQAPLQPVKVEPGEGAAARVTLVPAG